jgi:hypothetical protein
LCIKYYIHKITLFFLPKTADDPPRNATCHPGADFIEVKWLPPQGVSIGVIKGDVYYVVRQLNFID